MTGRARKSPWQRIYEATLKGIGVRLSADDIKMLSADLMLMDRGRMDWAAWHGVPCDFCRGEGTITSDSGRVRDCFECDGRGRIPLQRDGVVK